MPFCHFYYAKYMLSTSRKKFPKETSPVKRYAKKRYFYIEMNFVLKNLFKIIFENCKKIWNFFVITDFLGTHFAEKKI